MLEATLYQQAKSGISAASRLILIESTCVSRPVFHPNFPHFPITKFNPVVSDNSMFHSDMEFFVYPAPETGSVSSFDVKRS